jgi:AcrR family transcriptional regulator
VDSNPEASGPVVSASRPRGRRRSTPADTANTRALIVSAASREFASRGYDGASFRSIAREANVDPALVHHYFAEKADLFAESIGAPVRPDHIVAAVLSGPNEAMGENLVRTLLATLDDGRNGQRIIRLLHTALGHEFAAAMIRQFLVREVLHKLASRLEADPGAEDPELRATLAASQLVGLIMVRYGIRVEPLSTTPSEDLVRLVGPVVQWHLVGKPLTRD